MKKKPFIAQFIRAQLSSVSATGIDYLVTAVLFQFCSVGYIWATLLGAVCGGIFNCVVNYKWTFSGSMRSKRAIAAHYLVVWSGSILLNTLGVSLVAPLLASSAVGLGSLMSAKVIVSLLVGFFWNFLMQKYWVYRR